MPESVVGQGVRLTGSPWVELDCSNSNTELGGNYLDEHDRQAAEKRLVRCLQKLGYQAVLQTATQVA